MKLISLLKSFKEILNSLPKYSLGPCKYIINDPSSFLFREKYPHTTDGNDNYNDINDINDDDTFATLFEFYI